MQNALHDGGKRHYDDTAGDRKKSVVATGNSTQVKEFNFIKQGNILIFQLNYMCISVQVQHYFSRNI
jgi:hypothetical protein